VTFGVATAIDKPGVMGTTPLSGRGVTIDGVSKDLLEEDDGEVGKTMDGGAFRRCTQAELVGFWRFLR
jgi:hypothetical protein